MNTTVAEIKAATADVATSATQITASASSYWDVLKNTPGPGNGGNTMDVRLRAREGVKARQLLINVQALRLGLLPGTSNAGLADAANNVIRGLDGTEGHRFVSARRLNNGGILLELNDEVAAAWINIPDTRAVFLGCFTPDAVVKSRVYSMVVQFVPLHFKPEREVEIRQVEEANAIEAGSILHARWIKPPYRRAPNQTCSHVIFIFSKPDTTNKVLTNGLVICQKHVYAEKCKKELTRCLKCHGWGHLSYDCKQPYDMCGTCAGRHRMADFRNGGWPRCMSCQTEGHPSWAHHCPVFIQKCEEMSDRLAENGMPYFPTDESWTHMDQPQRASCPPPTPTMEPYGFPPEPRGSGFRQMTLRFQPTQRRPPACECPVDPSHMACGPPATGVSGMDFGWPHKQGRDTTGDSPPQSHFPDVV